MMDLNDLIPADSTMQLLSASWINDVGQIVGLAKTSTGEFHAFLASPIPSHVGIEGPPSQAPN